MAANIREQQLNRRSLTSFKSLYSALVSPTLDALQGVYRAAFVGPWWLRAIAGPGLYPLGLGGWWGKQFDGRGQGANIVRRRDQLSTKLPVSLHRRPSLLDGQPCLVVVYEPDSPFPWPWVIDELRSLEDDRLLGMTLLTRSPLNKIALPFLLTYRSENHVL